MRIFFLFVFLWSGAAFAQTYPDYQTTSVNDFAEMLEEADAAALAQELDQIRRDTGVEMTVVTLRTQDNYAPGQSVEDFAAGLFNYWGIGDEARNDGILVLILQTDRVMRLELGEAYGRDWDFAAERIVDEVFVDAIAVGQYGRAMRDGVEAIKLEIIQPFQNGEEAPVKKRDSGLWIFGAFAAFFLFLAGKDHANDALARFRTCPSCGRRGLRQTRRTTVPASTMLEGTGVRLVRCTHCDHSEETVYKIARRSNRSSGGGGFGGGRSGGGGATGRW